MSFLWFVCFCYLTNAWSKTKIDDTMYKSDMEAVLAFSFFSTGTFVGFCWVLMFDNLLVCMFHDQLFMLIFCAEHVDIADECICVLVKEPTPTGQPSERHAVAFFKLPHSYGTWIHSTSHVIFHPVFFHLYTLQAVDIRLINQSSHCQFFFTTQVWALIKHPEHINWCNR